jgi:hypothetical protein
MIFERFASTLVKALQPAQTNAQPTQARKQGATERDTEHCNFCGETGHFIGACRHVTSYIAEGKVKRDVYGKVVLPSGARVPFNTPGKWLRERVDEWHRRNPNQLAVVEVVARNNSQQLMYEIQNDNAAMYHLSDNERIAALEQEIYTLRSRQVFDGVEVPRRRVGPPNKPKDSTQPAPAAVPPRAQTPAAPTTPETAAAKASKNTQAPEPQANTIAKPPQKKKNDVPHSEAPLHPFRGAREPVYAPPHERNFAAQQPWVAKDKEPAYRSIAPIQDPKIAENVYQRSMNVPCITLSQKELLSLSHEVRQHVREAVTPKRITQPGARAINKVTVEEIPDEENPLPFMDESEEEEIACVIPDPYETYLNSLKPGQLPDTLTVAKESHALRSIYMRVAGAEYIESIVDPGSQIIAMSEAVCHDLGLAYDPSIKLNMQSANGEIDQSLGLARNVPCRIADIVLFLQIHVIRSPAYDILLGRPFDVLTESVVKNFANEDQTITIRDPNTNRHATIPTIARGPPRHQLPPRRNAHADFRMSRD